ncbi:MAG: indole-3-glycerol phosphate synthase TrpC [Deltaproteobacteria bacterium]|nr:indole-3-glycerol phosphate synthase TrpC [Deltaproteobacteria bacterium]
MGILEEILEYKKRELFSIKGKRGRIHALKERLDTLPPARDFAGALKGKGVNIIAEVKKYSPSKGVLRENFDPVKIAKVYERNGACAISVLTDKKYFMGSLEYLSMVKEGVGVPVLRKDFIIDPYQVYESRLAGADAILLIAAALSKAVLKKLLKICESLGMCPLVEVRSEEELKEVVLTGAEVIGINNRDLNTFRVDIGTTIRLAKKIPGGRIIVSESGITSSSDIHALMEEGVDAFLVGEALLREEDIAGKMRELLGGPGR